METDDEEEPVHRGPDHRGAGGAGGRAKIEDVCRKQGVSQQTFYRRKVKCGGMTTSDAQKLKTLKDENRRLKKLLAESMLDVASLKDLLSKD